MSGKQYYLKPNVVIEPLFDQWYAWPHLISPGTAAMNITGRHLKIMGSYIQATQVHIAAAKNPKMRGGPFMDYPAPRTEQVKELLKQTLSRQKHLIELSNAVKELHKLLENKAKGYSLEPLYNEIPELLKGYVELHYDLNNNASFRFFESLLYKSEYYNPDSQSIAMWVTNNDERPFCLSTPRLKEENVIHLNIPFSDPVIDQISRMKREPQDLSGLKDYLNIKGDDEKLFESFFTQEAPAVYEKYEGDKVRMRYFGHACILVETKNVSVLVDPLISYYGYTSNVAHFSDNNLPDVIDYVLITHNHQDHILLETLLPLRHKIRNIIVPRSGKAIQDPDLKLMFNHIGFDQVVALDEMETLALDDVQITGIPFTGEHGDLNIQAKLCYHLQIEQFSMMFFADSNIITPALYRNIHKKVGDVDVLFLGMECDGAPLSWLYGPLLPKELPRDQDNSRRFSGSNFERGMNLVDIFNPQEVYVYAMGQEPWVEFISSIKYTDQSNPIVQSNKLIEACTKGRGIIAERLFGEKELLYEASNVRRIQAQTAIEANS